MKTPEVKETGMSMSRTQKRVAVRAPEELGAVEDFPMAVADEPARRWALPPALRAGAPAWVWVGMGVSVLGFVLIAVGWGQVAGETQVYLQLPYVVSAAVVGLGLVIVGLTVLNIVTRQRDGIDRDRQITQLVTILEEVKDALAERDRR